MHKWIEQGAVCRQPDPQAVVAPRRYRHRLWVKVILTLAFLVLAYLFADAVGARLDGMGGAATLSPAAREVLAESK